MKDKTPKQIAKTIAISAIENSAVSEVTSCVNFKILVEAVEAALNAERERCAKIADSYGGQSPAPNIAAEIRGKQ